MADRLRQEDLIIMDEAYRNEGALATRSDPSIEFREDSSRLAMRLIEPDEVPADLRDSFWSMINRHLAAGKLTDTDIARLENLARMQMLMRLVGTPKNAFTQRDWIDSEQVIFWTTVESRRARDGFEREMISTTTRKFKSELQAVRGPGRLEKLLGRGKK